MPDDQRVAGKVGEDFVAEAVLEKGYHSRQTLLDLAEMNVRSFASEPARGRQDWANQADARDADYANHRRVREERGPRLLRSRGEKLKRTFAHRYETGEMRRMHLHGKQNVAKRALIHTAGFNLGLLMRVTYRLRKPRSLSAKAAAAARALMGGSGSGWEGSGLNSGRPAPCDGSIGHRRAALALFGPRSFTQGDP